MPPPVAPTTARATRSRFSSPQVGSAASDAGTGSIGTAASAGKSLGNRRAAQDAGVNAAASSHIDMESGQTKITNWFEPPIEAKTSFEQAGFSRHGIFESMAPLGALPKPKSLNKIFNNLPEEKLYQEGTVSQGKQIRKKKPQDRQAIKKQKRLQQQERRQRMREEREAQKQARLLETGFVQNDKPDSSIDPEEQDDLEDQSDFYDQDDQSSRMPTRSASLEMTVADDSVDLEELDVPITDAADTERPGGLATGGQEPVQPQGEQDEDKPVVKSTKIVLKVPGSSKFRVRPFARVAGTPIGSAADDAEGDKDRAEAGAAPKSPRQSVSQSSSSSSTRIVISANRRRLSGFVFAGESSAEQTDKDKEQTAAAAADASPAPVVSEKPELVEKPNKTQPQKPKRPVGRPRSRRSLLKEKKEKAMAEAAQAAQAAQADLTESAAEAIQAGPATEAIQAAAEPADEAGQAGPSGEAEISGNANGAPTTPVSQTAEVPDAGNMTAVTDVQDVTSCTPPGQAKTVNAQDNGVSQKSSIMPEIDDSDFDSEAVHSDTSSLAGNEDNYNLPADWSRPGFQPRPRSDSNATEVDREVADAVIEVAVDEAIRHCRYPTAWALRTLYDENRHSQAFLSMIEAVFHQTADRETILTFAHMIHAKKKEGRKDHQGYRYFIPPDAGSGDEQPPESLRAPYADLITMKLPRFMRSGDDGEVIGDDDSGGGGGGGGSVAMESDLGIEADAEDDDADEHVNKRVKLANDNETSHNTSQASDSAPAPAPGPTAYAVAASKPTWKLSTPSTKTSGGASGSVDSEATEKSVNKAPGSSNDTTTSGTPTTNRQRVDSLASSISTLSSPVSPVPPSPFRNMHVGVDSAGDAILVGAGKKASEKEKRSASLDSTEANGAEGKPNKRGRPKGSVKDKSVKLGPDGKPVAKVGSGRGGRRQGAGRPSKAKMLAMATAAAAAAAAAAEAAAAGSEVAGASGAAGTAGTAPVAPVNQKATKATKAKKATPAPGAAPEPAPAAPLQQPIATQAKLANKKSPAASQSTAISHPSRTTSRTQPSHSTPAQSRAQLRTKRRSSAGASSAAAASSSAAMPAVVEGPAAAAAAGPSVSAAKHAAQSGGGGGKATRSGSTASAAPSPNVEALAAPPEGAAAAAGADVSTPTDDQVALRERMRRESRSVTNGALPAVPVSYTRDGVPAPSPSESGAGAGASSSKRNRRSAAPSTPAANLLQTPQNQTLRQLRTSTTGTARATRSSRKRSYDDVDNDSSPVTGLFPPEDLAVSSGRPQTPSNMTSRAGTPGPRAKKPRVGLRVKTSPVKRKPGAPAGLPRPGERGSPVSTTPLNPDDNDDFCSSCGGIGELVCCDGCTRAFHFRCVDPPMQEDGALPEDWFCNVCLARRDPSSLVLHRGVFGSLLNAMDRQNSVNFALPANVRNHFEGVKTGPDGEYEEVVVPPTNHKPKRRGGYDETPDFFRLRDEAGNLVLCHNCHGAAEVNSRPIIPCAYCQLWWHIDCVDPPMATPPVLRNWRCPAHADHVLTKLPGLLGPAHKFRKVKGAAVIKPVYSRGLENDGFIEFNSDDEEPASNNSVWRAPTSFGRIHRVSARGVELDFLEHVRKERKKGQQRHARIHRDQQRLSLPHRPSASTAPQTQATPGTYLVDRRGIDHAQAAHNLCTLQESVGDSVDRSGDLINALLSNADDTVIAVMAQGSALNMQNSNLTQDDRAALAAMRARIDQLLLGTATEGGAGSDARDSDAGQQEPRNSNGLDGEEDDLPQQHLAKQAVSNATDTETTAAAEDTLPTPPMASSDTAMDQADDEQEQPATRETAVNGNSPSSPAAASEELNGAN